MTRLLAASLILCLSFLPAAFAQSLPEYQSLTVNDYAEILDETVEAKLDEQLAQLRKDNGVEMTVLTLKRRALYTADQSLEEFATAVFNSWGVGDKTRNDGVLIMVLRQDREMRIELGSGYGPEWDRTAAEVTERSFLPAFKTYDYAGGITTGVTDTINSIVLPFRNGESAKGQMAAHCG